MVGARRCGTVWLWVVLAVFEFVGVAVVVGGHGMSVGDRCGRLFAVVS
jgi:hypothetical protein